MVHIRKTILAMLGLFACMIYTQAQDTTEIGYVELADSVYGELSTSNIPSGRLLNRGLVEFDSTRSGIYSTKSKRPVSVDDGYALLIEKKYMSIDTSLVVDQYSIFDQAMRYMSKPEYALDEKLVIPFSIVDFDFEHLDESSQFITQSNGQFFDNEMHAESAFKTRRASIIAPLMDFQSDEVLYFSLPLEFRLTDLEINNVEIYDNGQWNIWNLDQLYEFHIDGVEEQVIRFRVYLEGHEPFERIVLLHTPNAEIQKGIFDVCHSGNIIVDPIGNILEYCRIPGCRPTDTPDGKMEKPFIMFAGYRPPLARRPFDSQRDQYDLHYGNLMTELRLQGYDIYLVQFNYSQVWWQHGIKESAALIKRFLREVVNPGKQGSNYETLIQAASFSTDASRIALMEMEDEHFNGNADPHHCRLLISLDAQYHGANVPLSSQYLAMSNKTHINPYHLLLSEGIIGGGFLQVFANNWLYAASRAKGALEMLQYSAWANNGTFPFESIVNNYITPTHHYRRTLILDRLEELKYPGQIVPMPKDTRHIAVSMGRYHKPNYVDEPNGENFFFAEGETNYNGFGRRTKFAKYVPDHYEIFRRRDIFQFAGIPYKILEQKLNVSQMEEIDCAAGSYHLGFGNIAWLNSITEFGLAGLFHGLIEDNEKYYTHKSTVSALAINHDYFGPNLQINLHDHNLMWDKRFFDVFEDEQSNRYGYPNLGKPNTHFNYTPFEAIYVDTEADPHIDMENGNFKGRLVGFYLREAEPDVLILQNDQLGKQARMDYEGGYVAKRRAKKGIHVSRWRSPMTDMGEYSMQSNATLILRPGEYFQIDEALNGDVLIFDTGGGVFDLEIVNFNSCDNSKIDNSPTASNSVTTIKDNFNLKEEEKIQVDNYSIQVSPNPSTASFNIQTTNNELIKAINIKSLTGQLIWSEIVKNTGEQYVLEANLKPGEYVLTVMTNVDNYVTKIIKL